MLDVVSSGDSQTLRLQPAASPFGCDSHPAHHSFINSLGRRQVVEKWCRYGGSIESISVVRDSFREEHARARPIRTHVVIELRECRQHAFHQLAGGRVINRFGCRPQGDAERFQMCAEREVVVLFLANRVRLYTTTKWTLPLCVRQYFNSAWIWLRSVVLALSPSSWKRSRTS